MINERAKIIVRGAVQGVGFRPFVFRLASELDLHGNVLNSPQGVFIEIEGPRHCLDEFIHRLEKEKPPCAIIQNLEFSFLAATGYDHFEILESDGSGDKSAFILPDIATCPDCLSEIFDPKNGRYLYPFTNCTNCGPRFSIIESLPYDRANTSMKQFAMCSCCEKEYHNPRDRRFHAQPNACPNCGPQLELWDNAGNVLSHRHDALSEASCALRDGKIVALKSIGGFQLLADGRNEKTVQLLRLRKHREEKPFALMFPTQDELSKECEVSKFEKRLLKSTAAPIVLLQKRKDLPASQIANSVAPRNPQLGVMLPYSPLHHILLRELDFPVVATSGNVSGEPICIDEREAVLRLTGIADFFLVHNRPIVRPVDDSIVRIILNGEQILRRARGYTPLPIQFKSGVPGPKVILATGAHLKNTIALAMGDQIFLSQHIGDLETQPAYAAFKKTIADFEALYDVSPDIVASDVHPEYLSSKFAGKKNAELFVVQHHYAHTLACAAENEVVPPLLGVAWDGTGLGTDGKIWGGEFLLLGETTFERVAHFREFPLPGGDAAIRQPRRTALGLLWALYGEQVFYQTAPDWQKLFSDSELLALRQMLSRHINSPMTSSVGRLFDAVASLAGVCQRNTFEGQAAMALEFAVTPDIEGNYPFGLSHTIPIVVDWEPMLHSILRDINDSISISAISTKFHNTLVEIIIEIAKEIGEGKIALSGGCFQNKVLLERSILKLLNAGFKPFWPQRIPSNDGGIAFGQAVAALRQIRPEPLSSVAHEYESSPYKRPVMVAHAESLKEL